MKTFVLALAALGLAACSSTIDQSRVVGHVSPVCEMFPTIQGCVAPPGTERIGTLIVVK